MTPEYSRSRRVALRQQDGLCIVCGKPISGGFDAHHLFVPKNYFHDRSRRAEIDEAWNLVAVHHGDCHGVLHTREGRRKACLAKYALVEGGYEAVLLKVSAIMKTRPDLPEEDDDD